MFRKKENGFIHISVISKGFIWAFRNGFAPVKIFVVLNTTSPSNCVRFPQRTTAFGETLLGVSKGVCPFGRRAKPEKGRQ